jgi:hypothetical protein
MGRDILDARRNEQAPHWPALLISGMHRSGTSMTAQAFQAAGLFIGDQLVPALPSNPEGHFEDVDFHRLGRGIVADNGYPDSGLVSHVRLLVSTTWQAEAESLIAKRRARGTPWGWKDPRSVLLLEFWAELLPEAHFLFTFRAPWDVMDSLYRRGDVACQDDPHLPLRAWLHYNRKIRDFVRANPARVSLLEVGQMSEHPGRCIELVASRMGIRLRAEARSVRPELMLRAETDDQVALVNALSPSSTRLYAELCMMAGVEAAIPTRPSVCGPVLELERALVRWARSRVKTQGPESV